MPADLAVDTDALRRCAAELADAAGRVADGIAQSPPLGAPSSGWATADALAELERAADRRFGTLAAAVFETSRRVGSAADEYEGADERAAGRLRGTR
jgi:hypothetical protein